MHRQRFVSHENLGTLLKLFSFGFLFRSLYTGLRYPSLLLVPFTNKDAGEELDKRRKKEWESLRLHYRSNPKLMFGLKIFLNPEDFSTVSSSIGTTGRLDLALTELLRKLLKPGMNVVDVGANIGYYTLLSSRIVGTEGRVYAFEPEPHNFELLNKSIDANNLDNVRVYQGAVSDKAGLAKLYLSDSQMPQAHSISRDWGRGSIDVNSTTLDSLWESLGKPHVDLIKIHVGESDRLVLRGAKRLLSELEPFVIMVFVPSQWKDDYAFLDDLFARYKVFKIVQSPFLIQPIQKEELFSGHPVQLLLA